MLFCVCVWVKMMLAPPEIRKEAFVAPAIISRLVSPLIIIEDVATDPATCMDIEVRLFREG